MALWKFGILKKIRMKSFQQYISKSIWVRGLKLGRGWWLDYLIKFKKKNHFIFPELLPFENSAFLNLSARYLENYLS